jgi:phenylacetate-coenzyme A ligase PaaK-like adenylate-forming protein
VLGTGGHYVGASWIERERRRFARRSDSVRVFSVKQPLEELVAALNAFDPTMFTAYPSALELLAEEQAAGRLKLRPALIECAGESMAPDAAARLAATFGCAVRNLYAASEFMFIAFGCDHDWLHVNSDWAILEPVDENFRATPPGELSHSVLLTNLANRVQPLIRYDLGDAVLARPDPCPCGNPLPAIRVSGRRDDILRFEAADGRSVKVLAHAIGLVLEEIPGVQRGQLVQTGAAAIRLRLEIKAGVDGERVWRNAIAKLAAFFADQRLANVGIVRAGEAPQQAARFGKFRQVIAAPRGTGG